MIRNLLKVIAVLCMISIGSPKASCQKAFTPPSVMIVPDLVYCVNNGYITTGPNGETIADYERAMSQDQTLNSVLTQIAQLVKERNSEIVIIDLQEAINNAKADEMMALANNGDDSEMVDEGIIRNSNADILVKVNYDLIKTGPSYQVSYTLKGTDPYTSSTFAPVEGLGDPSTSASPAVLLREAVYNNMDGFLNMLLKYYNNMLKGGRMVAFEIKIKADSGLSMDSRVGDYSLKEEIEDFIYDNSVEGKGVENAKIGSTFMQYKGVYIPVIATIRGRQRKQGAKDVAQKLVNFLKEKNISAQYKVMGLGKVMIYLE